MHMTRSSAVVVALVCVLAAAACSYLSGTVVGSGNAKSEARAVDSFNAVRVESAISATVIVGPDTSVTVTADDNLLANVVTTVTLGKLDVSIQGSITPRTSVSVAITTPSLGDVEATSAANVTATGVNTSSLDAEADSAATLVVRGNANTVEVTSSSAATADLGGVPAQSATAHVDSAARATVNAQLSVSGSVDSAGVLHVEGNPPTVEVTTNSGGAVVRD